MTSRGEKAGGHSRGPHRPSSPSLRVALVANAEMGAIRDSLFDTRYAVSAILFLGDAPRLPCRCQKVVRRLSGCLLGLLACLPKRKAT